MSVKECFIQSMNEIKNIRVLTACGILGALAVALKFVASIDIGQYVRIGISNMPGMAVSVLFGPSLGGIFWGMLDVIKYLVAPSGPFFPGFTLCAVLNGVIFGLFLYRRSLTLPRMFLAQLTTKLFVNLLLNTYWLSVLYGNGFLAMLPARVISNAIMLPIDTALSYVIIRFVQRLWNSMALGQRV